MDSDEIKKNVILTEEELRRGKALMQLCEELKKKIETKLSKIQARTGFSLKQLKEFFEIKSNFSEEKWNEMEKQKSKFDLKFKGLKNPTSVLKKQAKLVSKKKSKKFGNRARQRPNWLPM